MEDNTMVQEIPLQEKKKIGTRELRKASATLQKYKDGKKNLERKIIENEEWWKLRHWRQMKNDGNTPATNPNDPEPASGWLFNSIIGKHADAMDAYPEPNILPRSSEDQQEASMLSSIVPVVLEQNRFEDTYSEAMWYKLKQGTTAYGVFWDSTKLNGLGDISIKKIDLLNIYWEPGITDIQKSRNLFITEAVDNEVLEETYPQLKGKLGKSAIDTAHYVYDDAVDTTEKSIVVDWYYHTLSGNKRVLQYCKYVNDTVLYASEDDTEQKTEQVNVPQTDPEGNPMVQPDGMGNEQQIVVQKEMPVAGSAIAEKGWYEHGMYPVVFDTLFPEEGTCYGFGYIDVCREAQKYIDILGQAILKNTVMRATPRYFSRNDGSVNEEEFADWTKPMVHTNGSLGEEALKQIEVIPVDSVSLSVLENKINEMKEVSGNRDVNNGGTTSGVTAASAIAAMQESSGKTSRDATKASYRVYEQIVNLVIELIRQFYDLPRQFRIVGEDGTNQYVQYSNEGLKPQEQGNDFGLDLGVRLPVFDIKVSAQKQNPYSKVSQNELALQLFQLGMFNPQLSDQALATVNMMDFDDKQKVLNTIQSNGTMYQQMIMMQQQMLQMAQIIDKLQGTNMAEQMASGITGQPMVSSGTGEDVKLTQTDPAGNVKEENKVVEDARAQSQATSQPR